MLSPENCTTTKELLLGIEKAIVNDIKSLGNLRDVKFFSVGYPKQINAYPYIILIPVNEKILRSYTGNYVDVARVFRFIITAGRLDQKASYGQSTGIANTIKTLFSRKGATDFWQIKSPYTGYPIVNDTRVTDIQVSDPLYIGTDLYIKTSLDITFLTQIKSDELIMTPGDRLIETNLKELTKIVFEILESYKATLLKDVRTFKYGAQTEFTSLRSPILYTSLDYGDIVNRFVGVDLFNAIMKITCVNDVFTNQSSIYQNVDIIDKVRKIMFANKHILNRCFNFRMGDINYGLQEGEDLRYISELNISTSSYEPIN